MTRGLRHLFLAAAYLVAGWVGIKLAAADGAVPLAWPPMGVAIAAFVLMGPRVWPTIFLASLPVTFAAVVHADAFARAPALQTLLMLAISLGNTVGPWCASLFLRRPVFEPALERLRDVLTFILFGVVLGAIPTAAISALMLIAAGATSSSDYLPVFWASWASNAMGALIIAPLALTWPRPPWPAPMPGHVAAAVPLVLGLALVNLAIFNTWLGPNLSRYPLAYAVFPFVIWGAVQFGPFGAAVVSALTALLALLSTSAGRGPFAPDVVSQGLLLSTLFLGGVCVTALVLAGAFAERSRADAARSEAENRQRALLSAIPDLMFVQDAAGRYLDYHAPENARLLLPPDQFLNRSVRDILPPSISEPNLRCIADALRTGLPHSFEYDHERDGQLRHFEVRVIACGPARVLTIVRDITERKRAAEQLALSRAALEHAQGVAHIGSWTSEPSVEGRLTWSKETFRIFGVDERHFIPQPKTFFDCVHPDDHDAVRRAADEAFRGERPYSIDHRIIRQSDGTVRWVHQEAVIERDAHGRVIMFGVCQDITDRRRLEDQLLQARKMESIGRLAGGVAHDFNNTITAILGFAEMSLRLLPQEHAVRTNLRNIAHAATHAADLTRQLLTFARKQIVQPRILDLNEQVRKVEPMLRQLIGDQVVLRTHLAPDLGPVRADAGQIDQVLVNLAVNARDAMTHGGTLTLSTANVDVRSATHPPHHELTPGRYITLTVADTGVGMDAQTMAHCFDPFYTTKDVGKGTGLGLSTSYGIIKQAEGHIAVSSRPGAGTTFTIYLPRASLLAAAAQAPAAPMPAAAIEPKLSPPGRIVLLIEDEELVRSVAAEILRSNGYHVLVATDGDEGVAIAASHAGPIDLLITDVVMPRLRGPEAAERIRQSRPSLPVLFMSGYSDSRIPEENTPGRRSAYLPKPFTPATLLARAREIIEAEAVILP